MLYRRKVILALLEVFGREIPRTDFQKYLFLLSEIQATKSFEFVPYKFGSFSFTSYVDKRAMQTAGQIADSEGWKKSSRKSYFPELCDDDKKALLALRAEFGLLHGDDLIRTAYRRYPYYATKSEIAASILSHEDLLQIETARPSSSVKALYTIGYEGRSAEAFLNELLTRDIRILCDVRRNAVSMKYGYSGRTLQTHCEDLGIRYLHLPELGVASEDRKSLVTKSDFDTLFADYAEALPALSNSLTYIHDLVETDSRVAITCFERNATSCHRHKIAEALEETYGPNFQVIHI